MVLAGVGVRGGGAWWAGGGGARAVWQVDVKVVTWCGPACAVDRE